MKIAFFHPYFSMGGVEKTNIRLARYLISKGHNVDFISLSFSDHFKQEIDELGIKCIALEAKRTVFAIPKLRQRILQYDAFISCQNFANLVVLMATPRKHSSVQVIASERLHPDEFLYNGKYWKGKCILFLMKVLYKKADVIVANSQETAEEVERITGQKVTCIYNPTLTGDYSKKAQEKVGHEFFSEDIPIVVSVGRLAKEKGFDTLIHAIYLVNRHRDCRLVIVGEGEERDRLEALIKKLSMEDKVWLAGYDSNPYKYVSKANLFVLSSRFEGLPNTLIEALAVDTPCIATNCKSGPKEILLNGEGGILVGIDDSEAMAEAILKLLNDPAKAQKLLANAKAQLYRFTPEEVGRQYESILLDPVHGKCRNN